MNSFNNGFNLRKKKKKYHKLLQTRVIDFSILSNQEFKDYFNSRDKSVLLELNYAYLKDANVRGAKISNIYTILQTTNLHYNSADHQTKKALEMMLIAKGFNVVHKELPFKQIKKEK